MFRMSDPMTNREIEDVLSSIRRLVSEDIRPAARTESLAATPVGLQPVGRLVLTPAFRVPDHGRPDYSRPDEATGALSAPSQHLPGASIPPGGHAEVAKFAPANEEAGVDVGVHGTPAIISGVAVAEMAPLVLPGPADAEPQAGVLTGGMELVQQADAMANVQPAPAAVGFDAAPATDGEEDRVWNAENAGPAGDAELASRSDYGTTGAVDPEADLATDEDAEDWSRPENPSVSRAFWAAPIEDVARLEETIAELEAAVAASGEEFEPDGSEPADDDRFVMPSIAAGRKWPLASSDDPVKPRRLHLGGAEAADRVDDRVQAASANPTQTQAPNMTEALADAPDTALFDQTDDMVMDEPALRELVIEIIRQELQGALGERITRNVRKLVRAEIHRAMAGREFE